MDEPLVTTRTGHVETWTLNRPQARNPISADDMIDALVGAADRVGADEGVRAVVLTGAGQGFSAGGDVKAMAARTGMFAGTPAEIAEAYRRGIQRVPLALHRLDVPIVAAVNGAAVGAGCDLALMCDVRIASSNAFFAENFVRIGLIAGDGGSWFLPRVVGAARAAEMTLTGDRVDAATALEWGLVSRVVEPEALLPTAQDLAARIAANPPHATRLAKRLLRESAVSSLAGLLETSAAMQASNHHTADHREAVQAFVEKREPRFEGR